MSRSKQTKKVGSMKSQLRAKPVTAKQFKRGKSNDEQMLSDQHGDDLGALVVAPPVVMMGKIPENPRLAISPRLDVQPIFQESMKITKRTQELVLQQGGALDILADNMALDDDAEVTDAMKHKVKIATTLVQKTVTPLKSVESVPDKAQETTWTQDVTEVLGENGSRTRKTKQSVKVKA
jgi:hypothetical protein